MAVSTLITFCSVQSIISVRPENSESNPRPPCLSFVLYSFYFFFFIHFDCLQFPVALVDAFAPETKCKESPQPAEVFAAEFEDNFDVKTKEANKPSPVDVPDTAPTDAAIEKPKLTENEMKKLRLELENAEYLQLKSLLQAKINSEQFEIVKLRSQVALKNKLEGNAPATKETKDYTPEEQELRQRLMKENAMLEQKRMGLISQIFQERVACTQLKIELAMKELL